MGSGQVRMDDGGLAARPGVRASGRPSVLRRAASAAACAVLLGAGLAAAALVARRLVWDRLLWGIGRAVEAQRGELEDVPAREDEATDAASELWRVAARQAGIHPR